MRRCEVGNHEIAQSEDDHRCFHCNRTICKAHMGNPDGLPGDLVACVDHVAEVRRKEAQLRLRRLRNQDNTRITWHIDVPPNTSVKVEPTPTHDGKLDDYTVSYEEVYTVYGPMDGICIKCQGGPEKAGLMYKQALSLLAWLEQEKATLEQLAKEQA